MSIEENALPKRRSAAANRRRRGKNAARRASSTQQVERASASVATADVEEPAAKPGRSLRRRKAEPEAVQAEAVAVDEPVDRNARRREERRRAKQQQPERRGVGRVVNTERFSGPRKFYHDTASEIRKVVWPDRETTRNLTIVVIVLSVIMGALLGSIDFVLFRLFEAMG